MNERDIKVHRTSTVDGNFAVAVKGHILIILTNIGFLKASYECLLSFFTFTSYQSLAEVTALSRGFED